MNIHVLAPVLPFLFLQACSHPGTAVDESVDASEEEASDPAPDSAPPDLKVVISEADTRLVTPEDAATAADSAPDLVRAAETGGTSVADASADIGSGTEVAASLSAVRLEVACRGTTYVLKELCTGPRERKTSKTFGGERTKTYDVTIRIRGLVEGHLYLDENGKPITTVTATPFFGKNVTPDPVRGENAVLAIFQMDVSEPRATHYLNVFSNINAGHRTYPIDYVATVRVKGGAAVDLIYKDGNTEFVANFKKQVVPGVAPAPAPFNGMFVQLDGVSVSDAK